MSGTRIGIFCGSSLPAEDRPENDGVTYLAPAARNDVIQSVADFDVLLLIDGVFHYDLAPSPKECYAASQRLRFFGASSMGALRSAECRPYGMTPLGIIARWYVDEVIDGDDEVGVLVDPQTQTALSVPLVNVRYVAWLAQRCGLLDRVEAAHFVKASRNVYYTERTWDGALDNVPAAKRRSVERIALANGDLKRHDARFALRSVLRRFPSSP